MLVVIARLSVDPNRIAEFEALARQLWSETVQTEAGCRRYEYIRLQEPAHYVVSMEFDDHDAFLDHQASDHHSRLAAGPMRDLILSLTLEFGLPVVGASGPSPAPTGPPEERGRGGTVGAPALRDHYAARYPAPDPDAWGV